MGKPATAPAFMCRSRTPSSRTSSARGGQELGPAKFAVGQIFLPRTDLGKQERCRVIVEREILNYGYTIYGWRQVPVNIGVIARRPMPPAPRSSRS